MLKLIIEKELREILGSTKFVVTFSVCATLILIAFYVGGRSYDVSRSDYEAAVAENVKQMAGLTDWGRIDHRVFLEPQPLGALVTGIANDIGRTTEVRTRGELNSENSRFNEDPLFAVFRFLDLEFIFGIVLSLFAILFGYDAINGEKERGTLRLSFANAVPRDKYILGKLAGSFLALSVPLLIPILIGCLLLPILGVPMESGDWQRLAMIIACGYLYLGVFLALSIFISAMTEHSSSSFLLLLVVWIIAVLIVPRTAVLVSGRAVDVPTMDEINFEKNRISDQLRREDDSKLRAYWSENPQTGTETRDQMMTRFRNYWSELADAREQEVRALSARLSEDRRNRERVQQRIALGISRISPTSVFSLAATDLAGTSLELQQQYQDQVSQYRDDYTRFIEEKTGGSGGFWFSGGSTDEAEEEPIDPYELPVFEFDAPTAATLVSKSLLDLGLLTIFNIVFFVGAFVAFLRYDVR
ncbi:MAG: ABC transporter permease [Rhodothermales bacterium]|nr:ABC transporter permease [Rhodothermales bacterium]